MAKSKHTPQERRHEDYVYRDGRYYANYQVYDDGRIGSHQLADELKYLNEQRRALLSADLQHKNWMLGQLTKIEGDFSNWQKRAQNEFKIIIPDYDPAKVQYLCDVETGILTPQPIEQPEPSDTETEGLC